MHGQRYYLEALSVEFLGWFVCLLILGEFMLNLIVCEATFVFLSFTS